jgi:hypothetical protein
VRRITPGGVSTSDDFVKYPPQLKDRAEGDKVSEGLQIWNRKLIDTVLDVGARQAIAPFNHLKYALSAHPYGLVLNSFCISLTVAFAPSLSQMATAWATSSLRLETSVASRANPTSAFA